jgi:hypothetical protein
MADFPPHVRLSREPLIAVILLHGTAASRGFPGAAPEFRARVVNTKALPSECLLDEGALEQIDQALYVARSDIAKT